MKKSLIALAALSAFATAAQAQSSVSVYGVVDAAIVTTNNDAAGSSLTASGIANSTIVSNRLGFKGTEDLGGGLKANFVLEGALDLANGQLGSTSTTANNASTLMTFNRGAWAGLSHASYGEIRAGRQDISNMSNFYPAVLNIGTGNMAGSAVSSITGDKDKGLVYITPNIQGLTVQIGHSSASSVTTTTVTEASTGSVSAVSAEYAVGKLKLVAGKAVQKANAEADNLEEIAYGASYDFGVAKVMAGRNTVDTKAGTDENKGTILAVAVPLQGGLVAHAVRTTRDDVDTSAAANNFNSLKFAVTKSLSKRTTGYAAYTRTELNDTSSTSTTPTSYIFGMVHTF
jgi:predicted porin